MLTLFAVQRPLRRACWTLALVSLTSTLVGCGGGGTPETPSPAALAQIDTPALASTTANADSVATASPSEDQKLREALATSGGNEFNAPAQGDTKVSSPVVIVAAAADAVTAPASSGNASVAVAAQSLAPRVTDASAAARVFYVDSVNGRDGNAGTANDGTTAGPWQTLSRLQSASLQPGDTVRLVCGSVWNETLAIPASGTAVAPISIAGYPANCANPPVVDGATVVAAGSWTRHAGNVYKTVLPVDRLLGPNLIANGDLEADLKAWSVWSPNRTASLRQATACYDGNCMELASKADATLNLASSDAFSLSQGKSYYARYAVKAPVGVKVRLTLKRNVTPFDSLGHDRVVTGNGQWQVFEGTFVAVGGNASGRLDVELLAANSSVQVDRLLIATTTQLAGDGAPGQLSGGGGIFLPAHHPNKGYLPGAPQSQYLKIAADADKVVVDGRSASTYLPTGADLKLPVGAALTPGTKVRVRSRAWVIEDTEIASVSAGRIGLVRPTEYPLSADWGYF